MEIKFRTLKANEIEVRVAQTEKTQQGQNPSWANYLLYKDARVDMRLLDEVVGATNWQRTHARDNANCVVSIWDEEKKQWISKEDTGTESNTEAQKGLASDSFKRACFNWGIGRELYTAPKGIFIRAKEGENLKNARMYVKEIECNNEKEICYLSIVDKDNIVRYTYGFPLSLVNNCKSVDQLQELWKNNSSYHNNDVFVNAVKERKEVLQNQSK